MRFGLPACICCLVLLHPATQARPADLTADPEGGAALLKEGDKLADEEGNGARPSSATNSPSSSSFRASATSGSSPRSQSTT